ncbi:hypothetical protein LJU02_03755 [Corynebacterium pseudotuberculosis]|uniref:Secreted protein n=1 Tax=Corynebacterium pseudotuberculosis 258 TaxID=1168865 RepID=A0AAU8PPE8_CORPS|nr:hypothetical protein [Corynebacterium pseudotuberculosis]AER68797.1 Hypothetical protein Cp106_0717 [Corynebacterium pseudotuberculosis 1/06-A]AEQ06291.1 hypothetical protein CPCIP5297_03840 [Corynebacterium pseudotuberculosis CIP 52.97]AFB72071.2 hypothetical protein CP316_03820 [Corynebacterium pseudotuberculosis 316]AFH90560.2 hypothetical protein CP31_04050 [Corynebacterium pseudotuberculosis 31]AFK16375.1 hypothetical protein CP258_03835 [Corynebacterium pseudotuberculosis 258]
MFKDGLLAGKGTHVLAAGLVLATGLSACSSVTEKADNAGPASSSPLPVNAQPHGTVSADAPSESGNSVESTVGASASPARSDLPRGDDDDDSALTQFFLPNGTAIQIPSELAEEIGKARNFGALKDVEHVGGGTYMASFEGGQYLVYKNGDVEPVVGKIAETWIAQGGVDSDLGAPLDDEEAISRGWTQTFEKGTILWTRDGNGEYSAEIRKK